MSHVAEGVGINVGTEVELSYFSNIICESEIMKTFDLGSCIVHEIVHPEEGELIAVNSTSGRSLFLRR